MSDNNMWGALGRFAEGLLTGDSKKVADAFRDRDGKIRVDGMQGELGLPAGPKDPGKGCGARDGKLRCFGHTEDGACIMGEEAAK